MRVRVWILVWVGVGIGVEVGVVVGNMNHSSNPNPNSPLFFLVWSRTPPTNKTCHQTPTRKYSKTNAKVIRIDPNLNLNPNPNRNP